MLLSAALLLTATLFAATSDQLVDAGRLALQQGDLAKAVDLIEQAVKLDPNNSDYHVRLGEAYGQQARQAIIFRQPILASKTRNEFETAVKLDSNNIDARIALVEYYVMAPGFMGGSIEKALVQAQEIKKRDALEGHRAYWRIYNAQNKKNEAHDEMVTAVREQPSSGKAHYYFALVLIGEKNYNAAETELETTLRLDPQCMPAYFRLGQISVLASKNFDRGEEMLKKYLGYAPTGDDPPLYRAHYVLGQIYEKQGRRADARQSYATSLKINPAQNDVTEALRRVS
jgi:tetratricopeptide (TPR) repeat protein